MADDAIEGLPVTEMAEPDAHLYLWTINAKVEQAYRVARAWGFRPSTLLVWAKNPMGGGLGGAYGISTEFVLFARRGTLATTARIGRTWFNWKRPYDERGKPRHSGKPPELQEMIEEVSPGPYLELFCPSRAPRLVIVGRSSSGGCHDADARTEALLRPLRPFFSYYGAKHRIGRLYPAPRYPHIIEPFCGSAAYATRYHDRAVTLTDVDERIVGIWRFLTQATQRDILSLPASFAHIDEVSAPDEAKWFLGLWIVRGAASPRRVPSKWMMSGKYASSLWSAAVRARIAAQVERIRHWKVRQASFEELPDAEATWFVDAPYTGAAGRHYRRGLPLDYPALGEWCRSRSGQVIVCEALGADWLPFEHIASTTTMNNRGARLGRRTTAREAMWCSDAGDRGQRSFL